jgi:hypothetical protein
MGERRDQAGIGRDREPRVLTLTEIRCRVERIAEELSETMQVVSSGTPGVVPLDTRRFIEAMSGFLAMN